MPHTRTVTNVQLPLCSYGFRSGWATANVDGVLMRLGTSRSDRTDYGEHLTDVTEDFRAGLGQPVKPQEVR